MSLKTYSPKLAALAKAHFGRQQQQPSLQELKRFHRSARGYLAHEVLWFDDVRRRVIVDAIREALLRERMTCYACAVLTNHLHLLIRRHRTSGRDMVGLFKEGARQRLHASNLVPDHHPVFSADLFVRYKSDVRSVRNCIEYIHRNFEKHGLEPVVYDFVTAYNDWPFHKRLRPEG